MVCMFCALQRQGPCWALKDLPVECVPLIHTSPALPLPLLAGFLSYQCCSALPWPTAEGLMVFVGYLRVKGNSFLWLASQGLRGISSSDSCLPGSPCQTGKFCFTTTIPTIMELDFFTALHEVGSHFKWKCLIFKRSLNVAGKNK